MSATRGEGAGGHAHTLGLRRPALSWCLLPLLAGLLLLAACRAGQQAPARESPLAPTTPAAPQATPPPRAEGSAQPHVTPITPSDRLTLTIWGPDTMAPLDDAAGGTVLAAQMRSFAEAHPGWQVEYVRKKPYGPGGLVHFLRSTRAVAPQLLPDLVLVDMSEIGLLAGDSLLQPLEALLGQDTVADLQPFARDAGKVGDHLLAVQYEADLRFLAYNSAIIETPPSTWSEVLAARATYLLPIGASEGAVRDAFLPQYLALGGKLVDRDGLPYLDQTVVAAILEVYDSARQDGLLPAAGFDLKDASDCWPVYLTSRAAMTNVSSWDYGRERANRLAATRAGPLPTLSGSLVSLSTGWGWGLISQDPQRQAAAAEFLRTILQPEAMAAWSRETYHLPARRSALPLAIEDGDYQRFLQHLMEVAVPQPREPIYSLATEALGGAIEDVARGRQSPKAAAADAAERMRTAWKEMASGSQS